MQSLFVDVNTQKKALFKQKEPDTVKWLKAWKCIKSSAIQTSKRAANPLRWSVLSPFNWNYLSSYFVSFALSGSGFDGETLGKCGSIRLTEHHCDSPGNKSKMNSTLHETEMDIHKALPIRSIKTRKKTVLWPLLWNTTPKCSNFYVGSAGFIKFHWKKSWNLYFLWSGVSIDGKCVNTFKTLWIVSIIAAKTKYFFIQMFRFNITFI